MNEHETRADTIARIIAEHVPDLATDTKNTGLYKAILTFVEDEAEEAYQDGNHDGVVAARGY